MADHSFDELPAELLQDILSLLDWRGQMGVRRVSHRWRAVADACLARRRQLRVCGDDFGGHLSAEKLEQVLQSMPALQRLDVDGRSPAEVLRVDLVPRHCRQLVELGLVGFSVESLSLERLCAGCPRLESLSLADASHIQPSSFQQLVRCRQLRQLDLSRTGVSSAELAAVVTACPQLERLAVANNPKLGPDWVPELRLTVERVYDAHPYLPFIVPALPNLTHLDISGSNVSMLAFVLPDLLPHLRDLRIRSCRVLRRAGLVRGLPRLSRLQVLDMRTTCESASSPVLDSLHGLPLRAVACGRYCDRVRAASLVGLVLACPTLSVFLLTAAAFDQLRKAVHLLAECLPPDRDVSFIVSSDNVQRLGPLPPGGLRLVEHRDRLWETLADSQWPARI